MQPHAARGDWRFDPGSVTIKDMEGRDAIPLEEDPIDLVIRPTLPGTVVLKNNEDEVLDALAMDVLVQSKNCTRAFGDFHLAISSAPELEPLLTRLMYDPAYRELPWKRTHLWLVDEHSDNRRAKTLFELVVEPSDIPPEQVHAPNFSHGEGTAAAYQRELHEVLGWREKGHDRLDAVLLGLDARGRVGGMAIGEACCDDVLVSDMLADSGRAIAMSSRLISASRLVGVLASGNERRPALRGLTDEWRERVMHSPVFGVRPVGGEMRWYIDAPACDPK